MMTGATDPSAGSGDALGSLPLTMESQGATKVIGPSAGILQERGYTGRPAGMSWLGAATADSVSKIHLRGALSRPGVAGQL